MSAVLGTAPVSLSVPPPSARPQRRLSGLLIAFAALSLASLWGAVTLVSESRRTEALAAEVKQNANVSRALTEQTVRVLAAVDQATVRVRDAVIAEPDKTPDLVRFANETGLAPKILVQLSQVWADGRFAASNLDPDGTKTGHVDLSQREHVQVHLTPAKVAADLRTLPANGLFISKPVLGKVSKKWTIQLSRKIVGADGQSLGVVVASLDPEYFESVYRQVELGKQGGVTLAGRDLNVRARVIGGSAAGMGSTLTATSPFARPDLPPEGHYTSVSSIDRVERTFAYRKIAEYPLYVIVSTAVDESLTEWRANRNAMFALSAVLSIAIGGGVLFLVLGLRRLERAHAALQISETQAQSANKAKTEFLAAISHELRTPLTSIRGFAELMEARIPDPRFREQAGMIRKGAEHLNALLTEILDLSKVEAGAMTVNREPQDLRALVQGTVEFYTLAAQSKGLEIGSIVTDDVPATVDCDGLRVKQILNNLLSNAVKFTDSGRIALELERRGQRLCFHVVDTGPGIPPELHETIFERFRQGNDRVSYQHGGTGLGLALSRALAELMGGTLSIESAVGSGSRFTFSLPLPG